MTHWGLFRHYWVAMKFTLTIGVTILLLLHQFTAAAGAARRVSGTAAGTLPEVGGLGIQLVADAGLALLVLLLITTLSVFKPWGRTRYGRRKQQEARKNASLMSPSPVMLAKLHESPEMLGGMPMSTPPTLPDLDDERATDGLPLALKIFLAVIGATVVGFVVLHLTVGGLGSHGHW